MRTAALYELFKQHPVVCTDSRSIVPGCIYFSLKGETFDGNAFAVQSLNDGAAYAVVDDPDLSDHDGLVRVPDGLSCLQELAAYHRQQFNIPVLGITGSNGKTTTKELIYAVLKEKYNVLATEGNLNNHIGVPLTLLKLREEHEIAIIEMGASRPAEIKDLCDIAAPNYALITNIGKAHLGTMGGLQGVVKAKTELFDHVAAHGGRIFVYSGEKALFGKVHGAVACSYGEKPTDDVMGFIIRQGDLVSLKWKRRGSARPIDESPVVSTHLTGAYNLSNLLGAAAVGIEFGLNDVEIARGISDYVPTNNRSEVREAGGTTYVLDAYNANPDSMREALSNLLENPAVQRSVILGEMLELGAASWEEHRSVCQRLASAHLKTVCLIGNGFYGFKKDFDFNFFKDVNELSGWLDTHRFGEETVLIKGSRGNKLEKAAELLLNR